MTENARLTDYVLGRLSPEEESLVEQQYLSDPAVHDELRATERDVIDRYVRGELANPGHFERRISSVPALRQRVEFARALARSLSQAPALATAGAGEVRPPSGWSLVVRSRAWQTVAAALVVLAAGWLTLFRDSGQADITAPVPVAREAAQPPTVAEQPGPPPSTPAEQPRPARVATLALTSTATRGRDEMPSVAIDRQSEVRLELQLDGTAAGRYRAIIRTGDGEEVWRREPLVAAGTGSGPTIILVVPPGVLAAGDYTIRLAALTSDGSDEIVAGYAFRVRGR